MKNTSIVQLWLCTFWKILLLKHTYLVKIVLNFVYKQGIKGITGLLKSKDTLGNSLHSLYTIIHQTHVVWCHLRALIWLGGLVWFGFVLFDSIRFDSIRCVVSCCWFWFLFCSVRYDARGSISFFTFLLRSQAGSFILSKVQFIAKWNAAIQASSSQPPVSSLQPLSPITSDFSGPAKSGSLWAL